MIRIAGVVIPDNKHVVISIRKIFGIGKKNSIYICNKVNIKPHLKTNQLSVSQIDSLRKEIDNFVIEGDLRRKILFSIRSLIDIKCYRGIRHKKGLPVRGQKTKTNGKTFKYLYKLKKQNKQLY